MRPLQETSAQESPTLAAKLSTTPMIRSENREKFTDFFFPCMNRRNMHMSTRWTMWSMATATIVVYVVLQAQTCCIERHYV